MRVRLCLAAVVSGAIAALAGCAAYTPTPKLTAWDLASGYRFERLPAPPAPAPDSDELFVILAFSGGGTRAAALSYGVLEQLRNVRITTSAPGSPVAPRTLLDEVDVISSVSGGSFTSAYYALHRDGIFDAQGPFHTSFLYYPVQRDLLAHAAYYPKNWIRLRSRIEIAADDYADNIFGAATFAALQTRPRPYLVINSTDASTGARFEFTQEQFDLLCGDLSAIPIARAVAASSAFPGLLNSMTIDSHNTAGCGYNGPSDTSGWVKDAIGEPYVDYRRHIAARELMAYRDQSRRHLHLLDGGLADNIGLRSVLQSLKSTDRPTQPGPPLALGGWSVLNKINLEKARTIVVITVNARTDRRKNWDDKATGPGTVSVLAAAPGIPMGNFSNETLELLREYSKQAVFEVEGDPKFFGVEIAFENLSEVKEREFLTATGTNFELDRFEVDCLRDRGALLLRESKSVTDQQGQSFQDFVVNRLGGTIAVPAGQPHPAACTAAAGKTEIRTRNHYLDVGLQYTGSFPNHDHVEPQHGVGLAFRVTKPQGLGATVGFGSDSFDIPEAANGSKATLGGLTLRTLSAGVLLSGHMGRLEASAGLSAGFGFGSFTLTEEARNRIVATGTAVTTPDASNTFVFKPNVSLWHNLTDRFAATVSASYFMARPTLRVGPGLDRKINADAFRVSFGVGYKVF